MPGNPIWKFLSVNRQFRSVNASTHVLANISMTMAAMFCFQIFIAPEVMEMHHLTERIRL